MGRFARTIVLLTVCGLLIVAATSAANLKAGWLVPDGQIKLNQQYFNAPEHKYIALTFDDGPDEHGYTLQVSDILVQYGVPGTFFLIGERANVYPEQVKELAARGHEIGVHCYSHRQFPKLSADQQRSDITKCKDLLESLGAQPNWFRPPYGEFNQTTLATAANLRLQTVLWTNDPRDWSQPGVQTIVHRVLRDATPGGVILLHSTNAQTVAALPAIIDQLSAKGYRFVTMSQWQSALNGENIQAATAVGESFSPGIPEENLPRIIEQIEAQSPEDHAHLLWSSIRSYGRDTIAGHGMINWNKGVPNLAVTEQFTVYSNFSSATEITNIQSTGGRKNFVAFADAPPASSPASTKQVELAPIKPSGVVETPVQQGNELPALPAGEEMIIPPEAPTIEQADGVTRPPVGQQATAVAPPQILVEIPPLEERAPLPIRVSDLVDLENPSTQWQAPGSVNTSNFANYGAFTDEDGYYTEPNFYFLSIVGDLEDYTWVELETFVRLGRLNGMVLASEFTARPPTVNVSYPWTYHEMRWLDRGAVIDLTVEDTADVIAALERGKENVFIVVRPANLHFFIAAHLWAEMNYNMQDFVLLRQMTAGMSFDPATNLEEFWQLPQGVHLARFTDGQRTTLVLYSKLRQSQTVVIPEQFAYYSQTHIDVGGFLRIEPLTTKQVSVNNRPVVLYYEYAKP